MTSSASWCSRRVGLESRIEEDEDCRLRREIPVTMVPA